MPIAESKMIKGYKNFTGIFLTQKESRSSYQEEPYSYIQKTSETYVLLGSFKK